MVSTLRPATRRKPGTASGSQTIATTSTSSGKLPDAARSSAGVGTEPQIRNATEMPTTSSARDPGDVADAERRRRRASTTARSSSRRDGQVGGEGAHREDLALGELGGDRADHDRDGAAVADGAHAEAAGDAHGELELLVGRVVARRRG